MCSVAKLHVIKPYTEFILYPFHNVVQSTLAGIDNVLVMCTYHFDTEVCIQLKEMTIIMLGSSAVRKFTTEYLVHNDFPPSALCNCIHQVLYICLDVDSEECR